MVIIMRFYTASHGKFHDSGYSDIFYEIDIIAIMGCCTKIVYSDYNNASLVVISHKNSFPFAYGWNKAIVLVQWC